VNIFIDNDKDKDKAIVLDFKLGRFLILTSEVVQPLVSSLAIMLHGIPLPGTKTALIIIKDN